MTWILASLSVRGVKGVLSRAGEFKLSTKTGKPRSIAVFGRNGHGKSGYADAVEYLFSSDGEVEHLGKGGADSESGGKHAIPHVLAEGKGILPEIEADFVEVDTGKKFSVKRLVVTGRTDTRPSELNALVSEAPAHRVLRQHDLRRFVVDMRPAEKFNEFARWVGLNEATAILNHLTTTERILKETDVDREVTERTKSIEEYTLGAIKTYDPVAVFWWCEEEVKKYLSQAFPIRSLVDIEKAIQLLQTHREKMLLQSKEAKVFVTTTNLEKSASLLDASNGPLKILSNCFLNTLRTEQAMEEAQRKASQSMFREVWEKAEKAIQETKPDTCPVCQTPWTKTSVGSVENVLITLRSSLDSLSQFSATEAVYTKEKGELNAASTRLEQSLSEIGSLSKDLTLTQVLADVKGLSVTSRELIQTSRKLQDIKEEFENFVKKCTVLAQEQIPKALMERKTEDKSGSVQPVDGSITRLEGLRNALSRLEFLEKQQKAIRAVEKDFMKIAGTLRSEVQSLAENAISSLKGDVEQIYKQIHPGGAVPNVFIDLDTAKKALVVRINFYSTERKVPPGGYLSEAQINTLGLALFLSAVRLFNRNFPFVFLDDIVSSYDADNRARIVDVIAEYMKGFQVFLTTHDERFYTHLRQRLEGEDWYFEKITAYDFESGPRRTSDNLKTSDIGELIKQGDARIAGGAVRQFMEEWFDKMCEHYEVYTLHKRDAREYQRTLYDFWQPFVNRVKELKAGFGNHVVSSSAYQKMKASSLINYYNHYQANLYEWPSLGDVEYFWETFQEFTKLFSCHSCSAQLKYDGSSSKVYCTCGKNIHPTC